MTQRSVHNSGLYGAIFDLDGVLVDTARYHFEAWRRLAAELGFEFSELDNERLKGVSRESSLDILLEVGGVRATPSERRELAARKNRYYVDSLGRLNRGDLLPGALESLQTLREIRIPSALASASRNAQTVLQRLGISSLFAVVVDGTAVRKAKPNPEIFLLAAAKLKLLPSQCAVFEDAEAGVRAARSAGCYAIGIGSPAVLGRANLIVPDLAHCDVRILFTTNFGSTPC